MRLRKQTEFSRAADSPIDPVGRSAAHAAEHDGRGLIPVFSNRIVVGAAALFGTLVIGAFVADASINGRSQQVPVIAAPQSVDEIPEPLGPEHGSTSSSVDQTSQTPTESNTSKVRRRGPTVFVLRVIDGDTIEVSRGGRTVDVRLIGIDTPETVHPSVGVECYGPQASQFTTRQLEGRRVVLEFDVERADRYGRALAYVWLDGRLFNQTLVRAGFAQVTTYPPNVEYVARFLAAQRAARASGRGLWSGCPATTEPAAPAQSVSQPGTQQCTPGYDPCLPPASDYDCESGSGDGPEYTGRVKVTGDDPYGLDSDGDGVGCE
ncbi:MAG TPA: thermonuclease family protein [Actinomycetota bacterium]|nr:thermonuclease family protein [Actinomycetota bacterium]